MSKEQPKPEGTGQEIFPIARAQFDGVYTELRAEIVLDLNEREERGIKTYGESLRAHNGRSALQDLYEELLDALLYACQYIAERGPDVFVARLQYDLTMQIVILKMRLREEEAKN